MSSKKSMSIFTGEKSKAPVDWKKDILDNILLTGTVETIVKPIIASRENGNLNHILNLGSGAARLQSNVVNKFSLIIEQPRELEILNPFEIRCCLCRKVISYPCWYYSKKYAVNHFHYFICFQATIEQPEDKPTCKCYRRI